MECNNNLVKIIKTIGDLAERCLNKRDTQDFLFKHSFLFSNQFGFIKILNSVSDAVSEMEVESWEFDYIKKVFLSYYKLCPDLSNLYFKLINNMLSLINLSTLYQLCTELSTMYVRMVEIFNAALASRVKFSVDLSAHIKRILLRQL